MPYDRPSHEPIGYVIWMCPVLVQKLCCQDPPGRGLVVLHMTVQGYEPCNTLDEILEQAAATYRWEHGCVASLICVRLCLWPPTVGSTRLWCVGQPVRVPPTCHLGRSLQKMEQPAKSCHDKDCLPLV